VPVDQDAPSKTVLTEASGHVEVEVPRGRAGPFEPQIVRSASTG
jgi:transposase-like protein